MQQIKMLACEGASGKLPVLNVGDADVVIGCAIVIAKWVTIVVPQTAIAAGVLTYLV